MALEKIYRRFKVFESLLESEQTGTVEELSKLLGITNRQVDYYKKAIEAYNGREMYFDKVIKTYRWRDKN